MRKYLGKVVKVFKGDKKICSQGEAELNCLEYKDGNIFIAHCLEFDLVAEGETIEEARNNLADLIYSQIKFAVEKDAEDKSLFHPAPNRYWEIYFHWKARLTRQELLKQKIPSVEAILDRMNCTYAHV